MRISDWSSDVCSSDLIVALAWLALGYVVTEPDRPAWIQEARSRPLMERGADFLLALVPQELLEDGDQAAEDARRRAEELRRAEQTYRQLVSPLRKADAEEEIGRGECRERVCPSV